MRSTNRWPKNLTADQYLRELKKPVRVCPQCDGRGQIPNDHIMGNGPRIRFECEVWLPENGHFMFAEDFCKAPEEFLKNWIMGAVSNIYSGPLTNRRDPHDGSLLDVPKVAIKYLPPNETRDR